MVGLQKQLMECIEKRGILFIDFLIIMTQNRILKRKLDAETVRMDRPGRQTMKE